MNRPPVLMLWYMGSYSWDKISRENTLTDSYATEYFMLWDTTYITQKVVLC